MREQKDSMYEQFVSVRIFPSRVVRSCSGNVGEEARGRVFKGERRSRLGSFGLLCAGCLLLDIVIRGQATADMVPRGGRTMDYREDTEKRRDPAISRARRSIWRFDLFFKYFFKTIREKTVSKHGNMGGPINTRQQRPNQL